MLRRVLPPRDPHRIELVEDRAGGKEIFPAGNLEHTYSAQSLAWSPDGALLSVSGNATVTPGGQMLAAAIGAQVLLVPLADPAHPRQLATLAASLDRLHYSPDCALLVATTSWQRLQVLRVSDGQTLDTRTLAGAGDGFSTDGKWLAYTGSPMQVVPAADLQQKGFQFHPTDPRGLTIAVAWAPGGTLFTMDSDAFVQSFSVAGCLNAESREEQRPPRCAS